MGGRVLSRRAVVGRLAALGGVALATACAPVPPRAASDTPTGQPASAPPTTGPDGTPTPVAARAPAEEPMGAPAPDAAGAVAPSPSAQATLGVAGSPAGDALFAELRAFVGAEVARLGVPGAAVGVLHEGTEYAAGFGVTSVDHPLPVDPDTLFQVGSITKTYTATAAMRLVDAGRLDIDRPVRDYLPGLKLRDEGAARALTARHLLTHTGGFVGDYFSDTGRGDDALARYVDELAGLEQLTPPGAEYSYCNAGFSLLGRVVEVVTGQTFERAVERLVLAPLRLERSFFFPEAAMVHRFAVGHRVENGRATVLRPWQLHRSVWPGGGLIASVRDQLRYVRLQFGGTGADGTPVLAPVTLATMRVPWVPSYPAMGLAWFVAGTAVSHSGGTLGQRALLLIDQGRGFVLSVLTNAGPVGVELIQGTSRWAYDRFFGLRLPQPPVLPVRTDLLDDYVGRYAAALDDVELTRDGDALVARYVPKGGFPTKESPPEPAPPPVRLGFHATERLMGLEPPFEQVRAEVLRKDGEIVWLRWDGRLHRRVR
jgi:CubicO group peptidase (beta-lactamase class C family)